MNHNVFNKLYKQKITVILVGLIFGLVHFSLVYHRMSDGFWADELFTMGEIKGSLSEVLKRLASSTNHLPLYFIIIKYWLSLFGEVEFVARLFSVLSSVGCIFFVMLSAKKIFKNETAAYFSGAVTALSPFLYYISLESRPYSFLAMLFASSLYFYLDLKEKNTWKSRGRFIISLTLLSYTHVYGIFAVISFFVLTGLSFTKQRQWSQKQLLKLYIVVAILFLPWGYNLYVQATTNSLYYSWIPPFSWKQFHLLFSSYTFLNERLSYLTYLIFIVYFVAQFIRMKNSDEFWQQNRELLILILMPFVIALSVSLMHKPILYIRYTVQVFIISMLFIGGFAGLIFHRRKYLSPIVIILLFMKSAPGYEKFFFDSFAYRGHYSDWKGAITYLDSKYKTDDVVINTPLYSGAIQYYAKQKLNILYFRLFKF